MYDFLAHYSAHLTLSAEHTASEVNFLLLYCFNIHMLITDRYLWALAVLKSETNTS